MEDVKKVQSVTSMGTVAEEAIELPLDVLFVTKKDCILMQIANLLNKRETSFANIPVERFPEIRDQLDLIGTVVIDAAGMTYDQQTSLRQIIEILDEEHIGAILLNSLLTFPEEYSLLSTLQSATLEELWGTISTNLSYRKRVAKLAKATEPRHVSEYEDYAKLALVETLTEQLKMAGQVQREFLPKTLPSSENIHWATIFQPAEWVSGDIYDVARLDEEHIGFYLLDAVGHSMPAAILTMFLKHSMTMRETHGNKYRIFEPRDVIKILNVQMTAQQLSGCQFATGCYCLFNTRTLELTFSRAGHPYPILIRKGQQPKQLESIGPLLGIFEQTEYRQETVQLQKGDKLLLYSDGAERGIGHYDETNGFVYDENFLEIATLPISEMVEKTKVLLKSRKVPLAEIDDMTIIGMEIL